MSILIKRYANRKLYNTASSRYITLKGIAELLDEGEEVRVIDNATGEDITSVALSQILVDSTRSKEEPSPSLLSQIMERGGDVLYEVLKKGVDDASGNLDEIQDRFRRIIGSDHEEHRRDAQRDEQADEKPPGHDSSGRQRRDERRRLSDWIAYASPDFDTTIQNAVERVFKALDLPSRKDIDALNANLARVAGALDDLQEALEHAQASPNRSTPESQEPAPD